MTAQLLHILFSMKRPVVGGTSKTATVFTGPIFLNCKMYRNFKSGIYMWTSPSGKIYIGQAKNLRERYNEFMRPNHRYAGEAIENARKKYPDFTKWKYQVLEECEEEKLNEREQYWIEYYDSNNSQKGYNLTLGGDGNNGYSLPEEAKTKISTALKGKFTGELNPNFGRHLTEEQKECRSYNAKFGAGAWQKKKDEEEAARLAKEEKLRQKAEKLRRRRIMSIDIETGEVERFDSLHQALKKYPYSKICIQRLFKGEGKTAYGKYWTYQDEELQKELKVRREEYLSKCQRKAKDYWTDEVIANLRNDYSTKKELREKNPSAYYAVYKLGLLNKLFPKAA